MNAVPWKNPESHNTYPGFCRDICNHFGLIDKPKREDSERAIELAERYFIITKKTISDKCKKDEHGLLTHSTLRDFFDASWLRKRYLKENILRQPLKIEEIKIMTVSLFKSTASGSSEIVVQTNAQSLDVFIASFSDALAEAIKNDSGEVKSIMASALKNAFPIAFSLAGYKAEKVSEARLLTCGFASPDSSELVAQSSI